MANNDGKRPGFDPSSMPTIIEQRPFAGAEVPPPAYEPPQAAAEPVGPKGIGELLGAAFDLYKKNFVPFVTCAAVALAPAVVITSGLGMALSGIGAATSSGIRSNGANMKVLQEKAVEAANRGDQQEAQRLAQQEAAELGKMGAKAAGGFVVFVATALLYLLTVPLTIAAHFLVQPPLAVLVADRAQAGTLSVGGAWSTTVRRIGPLLSTGIHVLVGMMLGFLACGVGALVVGFICSFAMLVTLVEKKSGMDAAKRSFEIVKADPLKVFLTLLVFALSVGIVRIVFGVVFSHFGFLGDLISGLAGILIAPFGLLGLVLLFDDIRRTKLNVTDAEIAEQQADLLPSV